MTILTVEELAATLPTNAQNGLLFDATGRLVVNTAAAPDTYLNGLPVTTSGALCVTIENAAPLAAEPTAPAAYEDMYD